MAELQRNGVVASPTLLKVESLHLANATKPPKPRYEIDELALEHGHKAIRLPPYHCHNAIELIWAQVKGHAARNNTESPFSTGKMLTLLETTCSEVTLEDWKKVFEKTKKYILNDLIISLSADSSDDSDSYGTDSSSE